MKHVYLPSFTQNSVQLRLGTRGSRLALWQANQVSNELSALGYEVDIQIIKTQGDKIQDLSFDKLEGKGFFTKEIEDALLSGEVDFAVHSMKDLPTQQPEGLMLAALSERADPRDTLLLLKDSVTSESPLQIKENLLIGTSSARRKANIKALLPGIDLKDIRGNVPTRIQKLRDGLFGGILLAKAGLDRLELDVSDLVVVHFEPTEFVPAPAQGVLAYQCRVGDKEVIKALRKIHSFDSSDCTNVERRVLQMMDGGCHLPLGVYCRKDQLGYYHAAASFSNDVETALQSVKLSQSTNHKMAEKIYESLVKTI